MTVPNAPVKVFEDCSTLGRLRGYAMEKRGGYHLDDNGRLLNQGFYYGWVVGQMGVYRVPVCSLPAAQVLNMPLYVGNPYRPQ